MGDRPRVLFLVHRIPYPPDKGDKIRSYNELLALRKCADVTVACIIDDPDDERHVGALRDLCQELDHKFILQRESKVLQIDEGKSNWKVRFQERGWVFPKADVLPLPIDNTTAERLAEWIGGRLREQLAERGATNLTSIAVGVEESPGQTGWWRE